MDGFGMLSIGSVCAPDGVDVDKLRQELHAFCKSLGCELVAADEFAIEDLIDGKEVDRALGIKRATRNELIRQGKLPKPLKLFGNRGKFLQREIAGIQRARIVASRAGCDE